MDRTSICVACAYYGTPELSLAVDPGCRSEDEADALCAPHRAKMTEGGCVLCGRREPWVSPWPGSRIGACRRCHESLFGRAHSDAVARLLAVEAALRMPEMADRWD